MSMSSLLGILSNTVTAQPAADDPPSGNPAGETRATDLWAQFGMARPGTGSESAPSSEAKRPLSEMDLMLMSMLGEAAQNTEATPPAAPSEVAPQSHNGAAPYRGSTISSQPLFFQRQAEQPAEAPAAAPRPRRVSKWDIAGQAQERRPIEIEDDPVEKRARIAEQRALQFAQFASNGEPSEAKSRLAALFAAKGVGQSAGPVASAPHSMGLGALYAARFDQASAAPIMTPPNMMPPSMTPPNMMHPRMAPPNMAPPSMTPPSMTPPSMLPPSMTPHANYFLQAKAQSDNMSAIEQAQISEFVEGFIELHTLRVSSSHAPLTDRVSAQLRELPPLLQNLVMSHGIMRTARDPNAVLVTRIGKAVAGQLEPGKFCPKCRDVQFGFSATCPVCRTRKPGSSARRFN